MTNGNPSAACTTLRAGICGAHYQPPFVLNLLMGNVVLKTALDESDAQVAQRPRAAVVRVAT